ncbi:DUF971 domain-containing protein [Woeseiaceae bacterium]|jgi:DUF971 family protein|nr:DUF971 domain-containing protein [Woeseiaceae bacterium]MDB2544334.1 DUF971 domain-containing protein [Woeseiaceae bacterium]|tara:strand:- start:14 stop:382 length:369 start_codon:yes stop_codon:yes gene_type:complete
MITSPIEIKLRNKSRLLSIEFKDNEVFELSFEFLRVHSPSAEVKGHSPNQAVLQLNKHDVMIKDIEPIGHYAIRLIFDDGHDSGLYTWKYLYELGRDHGVLWQAYLDQLLASGYNRPKVTDD